MHTAVLREVTRRWGLTVGPPFEHDGEWAWVAPARDGAGRELVLKIVKWFADTEHEADGLRLWDGDGAVRLYAAREYGEAKALLLERCVPGTQLKQALPEPEQDLVVAGLLRRLWRPAGAPFRPLSQMCDEWAAEFEQKYAAAPDAVDRGIARAGIGLFRSLPRTASTDVLLCTDLHGGNILAAEREPWLVIDPTPYVGDPAYDVVQHMLNCDERLAADPAGLATRMADLLDLDPERVTLWLFARCVQESPEWIELRQVAARLAP
ncbi:MAG TPA: aminoglycoside phosphotransferase family protein [Actinophytocola sp.]|uniref:aminoglycoside phosphotransferase family protein n=1 Tax=Actinophytocola sp. TaxID=1872138 RepID=UPI002DDD4B63|nr:aminoglycoside phosphotransferase family protein [Actinophytocola sp.]HEV2780457.1 aminoglycoside phosphotransferase family protein [Actinophytocola sp.]